MGELQFLPPIAGSSTGVGALAARPSAAEAGEGGGYFATDDYGGTLYISDGTDWHIAGPRGIELNHDERTDSWGSASLGGTGTADVPDISLPVTPRGRPILLETTVLFWQSSGAGAHRPRLQIRKSDGATGNVAAPDASLIASSGSNIAAATIMPAPRLVRRLVPGVHIPDEETTTFKLSVRNDTGAAVATAFTLYGSDLGAAPYGLRATEV